MWMYCTRRFEDGGKIKYVFNGFNVFSVELSINALKILVITVFLPPPTHTYVWYNRRLVLQDNLVRNLPCVIIVLLYNSKITTKISASPINLCTQSQYCTFQYPNFEKEKKKKKEVKKKKKKTAPKKVPPRSQTEDHQINERSVACAVLTQLPVWGNKSARNETWPSYWSVYTIHTPFPQHVLPPRHSRGGTVQRETIDVTAAEGWGVSSTEGPCGLSLLWLAPNGTFCTVFYLHSGEYIRLPCIAERKHTWE